MLIKPDDLSTCPSFELQLTLVQALLQAEEMAYAQRPGRASRLLDDRFDLDANRKSQGMAGGTGVGIKTKADTGPVVLNLSKELTREIFEEFPVVQDAYARHVPAVRHLSCISIFGIMIREYRSPRLSFGRDILPRSCGNGIGHRSGSLRMMRC